MGSTRAFSSVFEMVKYKKLTLHSIVHDTLLGSKILSRGIKKMGHDHKEEKREEKEGCKIVDLKPEGAALNSLIKQVNPKYKICCVREL